RHAEGVADGDGAAVDVQLLQRDAEVAVGGDHLGGERLVDLDQVDVVDGETGAAQRLLRRLDRAEAHDLGGEAGDTGGDDPGQRGQAELAGLGVAHDDQRGGAVVERAAVAGGDQPVGAEDRLQAGDAILGDPG